MIMLRLRHLWWAVALTIDILKEMSVIPLHSTNNTAGSLSTIPADSAICFGLICSVDWVMN